MKYILTATALLALAPMAAVAGVTELCLDMPGNTGDQCSCATEALSAKISAADKALYEQVGDAFLAQKVGGLEGVAAWDAAFAAVAAPNGMTADELMTRMTQIGESHNTEIDACR